jgi:hypothetical protein
MVEEYFKNPLILGLITFILIYVVLKYAGKSKESNKKILTKSIIGGVLVGIIGYCIINSTPVPEMIGGGTKTGFELSGEPKRVLLEELMSSGSSLIQGGGIVDEIAAEVSVATSSISSEILGGSEKIVFDTKPILGGSD